MSNKNQLFPAFLTNLCNTDFLNPFSHHFIDLGQDGQPESKRYVTLHQNILWKVFLISCPYVPMCRQH